MSGTTWLGRRKPSRVRAVKVPSPRKPDRPGVMVTVMRPSETSVEGVWLAMNRSARSSPTPEIRSSVAISTSGTSAVRSLRSTVAASMTTLVPSGAAKVSVPECSRWAAETTPAPRQSKRVVTRRAGTKAMVLGRMALAPLNGVGRGRRSRPRRLTVDRGRRRAGDWSLRRRRGGPCCCRVRPRTV